MKKESLDTIMKKFSFLLVMITALSLTPIVSNAATTEYIGYQDKTKIGDYYVWIDDSGLYCSKSQNSTPKQIAKKASDCYLTAVSDGKNIYYGISKKNKLYLYKCLPSGSNKKYLGSVKNGDSVHGYYNGEIIYSKSSPDDCTLIHSYRYNIKSKKSKLVASNLEFKDCYGYYYLGIPNSGDMCPLPLKLYNAKSKKLILLDKSTIGATIHKNNVYYASMVSYSTSDNTWKFKIKKYNVKTGKTSNVTSKIKLLLLLNHMLI